MAPPTPPTASEAAATAASTPFLMPFMSMSLSLYVCRSRDRNEETDVRLSVQPSENLRVDSASSPSNLTATSQVGLRPCGHPALMRSTDTLQQKVRAREAARRLLAHLTTGTAVGALAGVAVLGWVSAQTVPGNPSVTASNTTASSTGTTSSSASTSSSTSGSSSSGLSTSSGPVRSSSGSSTPVAVTGGSR